jgi:hypothetical protein
MRRPPPNWQGSQSLEDVLRALPRRYAKVLSKPSVAAFSAEARQAEWHLVGIHVLGWMTMLGIFGLLTLFIRALVLGLTGSLDDLSGLGFTFGLTLVLTLFIPTFLLVDAVLTYLLARAFGGRGTLPAQIYTGLLFQIPLSTVSCFLAFIPTVGILLGTLFGFGAFIYSMMLQLFATMAVHRLDARTATATVFVPAVVVLLLVWLFFAFFLRTVL